MQKAELLGQGSDSLSYTVVTGWEMKKQFPAVRAALWEHLIAQTFGLSLNDQMKASKTRGPALTWSCRTQEALLPFGEHSTTERGLPSLPCGKSCSQEYCRRLTVTVTKDCSALAGHNHPECKLVCVSAEQLGEFPSENCSRDLLSSPWSRCALSVCQ